MVSERARTLSFGVDVGSTHVRDADGLGLTALLIVIWRGRLAVALSILVFGIGAAVFAFTATPVYRAQTTFLPSQSLEGGGTNAGTVGLMAAAQQLGFGSMPGSDPTELFRSILFSRTFLEEILDSPFALEDRAIAVDSLLTGERSREARDMREARAKFESSLRFEVSTQSGLVTVTLDLADQDLVAPLLDYMVEELDRQHRALVGTRVAAELAFIGERVAAAEVSLREAEDAAREFLERNQRIADSPQLKLQYERLEREVQLRQTLFLALREQYEYSQIREVRELPNISVVDVAERPVSPSWPRLPVLVVLAIVAGGILMSIAIVTMDLIRYPPVAGEVGERPPSQIAS